MLQQLNNMQNHQQTPRTSEGRYLSALRTLPYFSGQDKNDRRNVHSEALANLEPDCDEWVRLFEHFRRTQTLQPDYYKRAFYDRLCGDALKRMRGAYMDFDLNQCIAGLRLKFSSKKTLDAVTHELKTFSRKRYEVISAYIDRYSNLLDELRSVEPSISPEEKLSRKYLFFISECTETDLRERLGTQGLNTPVNLDLAIKVVQEYYDSRNEAPWS